MALKVPLEIHRALRQTCPGRQSVEISHEVVARSSEPVQRVYSAPTNEQCAVVYGCLKNRLGCSPPRLPFSVGSVDSFRENSLYQLLGIEGGSIIFENVSNQNSRQNSLTPDRQFDGGVLSKQEERHSLHRDVCNDLEYP